SGVGKSCRTPMRTSDPDMGRLSQQAELLHLREVVADAPAFHGLTAGEAKDAYRAYVDRPAGRRQSHQVAVVGPGQADVRDRLVVVGDDELDLLVVVGERVVHECQRRAVTAPTGAVDTGQVDVVDEVFRDQLVDELDSTVVPDLLGDSPEQGLA